MTFRSMRQISTFLEFPLILLRVFGVRANPILRFTKDSIKITGKPIKLRKLYEICRGFFFRKNIFCFYICLEHILFISFPISRRPSQGKLFRENGGFGGGSPLTCET